MAVEVGWSRLTWNSGKWNSSPDAAAVISGLQADLNLNLGFGWNREEWNTGSWGEGLGFVLTGNGNVFATTTAGQLTSTANNISVTASAPITISGEQLNISLGEETVTGIANISITGEELISATVNTFAVVAGGAITINTPTLEANTALGTSTLGLANFIDIDGFPLSINLNNVDIKLDSILSITGNSVTSSINNITVTSAATMDITGNQMTINLSNANVTTQQILNISGNQANISSATLKFWDPIAGNITEVWTNIH